MKRKFAEDKSLEYSSVQKAISILLSFIPDNKPAGTLQLSDTLGINKSTVSRLIQVLMHFGLIQQDDQTKKYLLGRTSSLLGMAVEGSQADRLAELAQAHLDHLRDTVSESVCLEVLLSGRNKVIAEAIGPPPLSVSFEFFLPIHVAAGAKAILAFTDPDVVESIIDWEFKQFSGKTALDPESFKKQLAEVTAQGIAYDRGEASKDVYAVSVPVFNHKGRAIAAISMCVPSTRLNKISDASLVTEIKETARRISESLFPPIAG